MTDTIYYCPRCGGTTTYNVGKMMCEECNKKLKSIDVNLPKDDEGFPDWVKAEPVFKNVFETVIKASPEFSQKAHDEMEQKLKNRSWGSNHTKPTISSQIKCPKCNSTNIQVVRKKWSVFTGFLTNKVDRYCANCGNKI